MRRTLRCDGAGRLCAACYRPDFRLWLVDDLLRASPRCAWWWCEPRRPPTFDWQGARVRTNTAIMAIVNTTTIIDAPAAMPRNTTTTTTAITTTGAVVCVTLT
jgi:hypothetical protein